MKKFLSRVLLFFTCLVVVDLAFGQFFSFFRAHAKGGSTANCEYIANHATDDIIILGSSRATHHYVPQIIEDSLGVSCYNCGEEGNGIVLAYGRLKMLTNRYKPKLVLYEITPSYDYGTNDSNNKYLGYLRPYYYKDGIKELFDLFDDEWSWIKMKSRMYQNVGRLLPNVIDNMIYRENNKGYAPLFGKIDEYKPAKESDNKFVVEKQKLSLVEDLIRLCADNDIPLVFIISPELNYMENSKNYIPALKLCEKHAIPVYNSNTESGADGIWKEDLFQDLSHLNNAGAFMFTQSIIPLINDYFKR